MEKYITSLIDLVSEATSTFVEIKKAADEGDPKSCFQMGLIYLLGINTPIDFNKATHYLANQSLNDNQDAIRLLGLIAEFGGDFSSAFQNYIKAADVNTGGTKKPNIEKVVNERAKLSTYLKKLDLFPTIALAEEITNILSSVGKSEKGKLEAIIKIVYLCDDQTFCYEVSQSLYEAGYYFAASQWLTQSNKPSDNHLSDSIQKKLLEEIKPQKVSGAIQIVNLKRTSLLSGKRSLESYEKVKANCTKAVSVSAEKWKKYVKDKITETKKDLDHIAYKKYLKEQKEEEKRQEIQRKKRNKIIIYLIIAICIIAIYGIYGDYGIWDGVVMVAFLSVIIFLYSFIKSRFNNK